MMLGIIAEGFDPKELNTGIRNSVSVKNMLCCTKLNFVMVSFLRISLTFPNLPHLSGLSLKVFSSLFIPIFWQIFSNTLALPYFLGLDDL